jgi:tRNA (cmo5U34)-methyltransferase
MEPGYIEMDCPEKWDEDTSRRYLDYGRYFVPERELQFHIMVSLLYGLAHPCTILELCCGEGLLAELILLGLPGAYLIGLDGSQVMLERASERLTPFEGRFELHRFDLSDDSWRKFSRPIHGVVSSLAIHHLDGEGKQALFRDVHALLSVGGAFIIADMIEPATSAGRAVAADGWDEVVRKRSLEFDGGTAGLDFFQREGWNTYRYTEPDDIDHPSPLLDQLKWLEQAGFMDIDVHFFQAGHAIFSGWKIAE